MRDVSTVVSQDALRNLTALVQAMPAGTLLVALDGAIQTANVTAAAPLQRSPADLIGCDLHRWFDREDQKTVTTLLADGRGGVPQEFRLTASGAGARATVLLGASRVPEGTGRDDLRLVSLVDVSASRRDEALRAERLEAVSKLTDTVIEQAIALKRHAAQLEERVQQRTTELREANLDAIYMLAVACEAKDQDTGDHVRRIQHYAESLAAALGLDAKHVQEIGYSAILHDVGKMVVPDGVLKKPGRLTDDEWVIMRAHAGAGERILADKPFFDVARQIARHHHERWDGDGYPDRIAGQAIPMPARIVALADVFDALTSPRVYKKPWPDDKAIAEIRNGRDTHFDPAVVDAFDRLCADGVMSKIRARHHPA